MPNRKPAIHRLSGAIALALAAGLGLGAAQAQAATLTVTSSADPGNTGSCTLRQAITTANHGATAGSDEGTCRTGASGSFGSNDRIVFDAGAFPSGGANTITLAGSRLAISAADLAIDASANGNVTIDANHASGVMIDSAATGGTLSLTHLTLRNGKVTTADCQGQNRGGALCIPKADLTLKHSTLNANSAEWGGAVYSDGGDITLTYSTVSGNSAERGGGVYISKGGLKLANSTISGNWANIRGGGILSYGYSTTVTNSAISGNSAGDGGGGIYSRRDSVTLSNTTISGNSAERSGGGILTLASITLINATVSGNSADPGGGIVNAGGRNIAINNSIVSGNSGGDVSGGAQTDSYSLIGPIANLKLGPLADNGGPTQTMLPQPGSAAIDAGDDSLCPATDQRGVSRPQDAHCDIGAVESASVGDLVAANGSGQTTTIWHGFFNPLVVQVSGQALYVAAGIQLHVVLSTPGQAGASCTDAISNNAGVAYLYCRANGIAGSYSVEVSAAGWPSIAPATFVLTNVDDGDTLFRDGFDPPGPRTSVLTADSADADYALHIPGNMPDKQTVPLRVVTDTDGTPLLRVDAVRRGTQAWLRVVHYDHGQPLAPSAWRSVGHKPRLHVQRGSDVIRASIR